MTVSAFAKVRIVAHLLRGMVVVATRFPKAKPAERLAMNRAWSVKMLCLCGMKLVVCIEGGGSELAGDRLARAAVGYGVHPAREA